MQCMISKSNIARSKAKTSLIHFFNSAFVLVFFKTMYNKTIIRFGFCDMRNNQGLGKCFQPQPITLTTTLIVPDIKKTSLNNCLLVDNL